jgi:hypothetical protein
VPTLHPDISRLDTNASFSSSSLKQAIDSLSRLSHSDETEAIVKLLDELIPNSTIRQSTDANIKSQTSLLTYDI